jgi:glutamyl-tRNA(Gln) amidotransferase subunit E
MLLRSTGKVKRGLGTIRQDVNISIEEGARVEVKGVQSLEDIDDLVRNEAHRQVRLLEIRDELRERDASVGDVTDVTDTFADSDSGVIESALASGGKVTAVPLYGFDGLVGAEVQPDRRLGTELSDHAKRHGAGGIFHTDELPAYGVTDEEVAALREAVGASEDDAVAIVAADPETADLAIEAAAERAEAALDGVPEETRGANEDGTTRYLRPLPGAARMYPETDVPPVEPDPSEVETPELLTERVERYQNEYDLDAGLAEQVAYGERMPVFERAVESGADATLAAQTLQGTVTELRRDGVPVENLTDDHFLQTFEVVAEGETAKGNVGEVLTALAENPDLTASEAVEREGLGSAGEDEVREAIAGVVERNEEQVQEEGMQAFSGLMGEAMGALGGKADGDTVSELLREEIQKRA